MARRLSGILLLAIAGSVLIGGIESANILGIFTSLGPSHLIIEMSMVKVLAENGHNVTVITALKPVVNHKNINVIQVALSEEETQMMSSSIADMAKRDNTNFIASMFRMIGQLEFMMEKMESTLADQRVRDLYENQDNKFDLVIHGYFMNNYQLGLARKLKAPVIMSVCVPPNEMLNGIVGNPPELSYVPALNIAVESGKTMTFGQRLTTYFSTLAFKVVLMIMESKSAKSYNSLYGNDKTMPSYSDLTKNVSLILFASHGISEGPIRPNVPAVIEVGGIQIKDQPDPLPKIMEEFLSQATNGAILLSLGSNVQGAHLKAEIVQRMFKVLSQLKQKVIWKWEDLKHTPGKSANILYSKWLPQADILAHPKIKLFITHAGKGGLTEAQYHGKPMLALPVFADQPGNAAVMVKKGFGLSLDLLTLEEQPFREALLEVLENPKYAEKVSTFSALYRDRPLSARQSVLYWSEYVIRHHGAPHLQSPLIHMDFIASNNLDVYALLVGILIVLLMLVKVFVKFIFRKFISKKTKKVKKH